MAFSPKYKNMPESQLVISSERLVMSGTDRASGFFPTFGEDL
jgi:hypothetical protein